MLWNGKYTVVEIMYSLLSVHSNFHLPQLQFLFVRHIMDAITVLPSTYSALPITCYPLLTVHYHYLLPSPYSALSIICYPLPIVYYPLPATFSLQCTTHYLLPSPYSALPITCYLLLTVHYPLPATLSIQCSTIMQVRPNNSKLLHG